MRLSRSNFEFSEKAIMSEAIRPSTKIPLLNLPDRGLEKQDPVNVVTRQTLGRSYRIPLLALSRIACSDVSTFQNGHQEDDQTDISTNLTVISLATESAASSAASSFRRNVLISQAADMIDSDKNLNTSNRSSKASTRYFLFSDTPVSPLHCYFVRRASSHGD